jgi:hypothetical protein
MAEEWGIRGLHLRWARGAYFRMPGSSVVTSLQVVYPWLSFQYNVFFLGKTGINVLPNSSPHNSVLIFKGGGLS